jgi:hypothetical protein
MRNFTYDIVPNSIYQMTQSTRRLLLLQLSRLGLPIPPKYLMEQFDIPNPEKMIEEFFDWTLQQGLKSIEIQMELTRAQMEMGMMQSAATPLGQLSGAISGLVQGQNQGAFNGGGGGPNKQEGRPPTAQKPPHMEQKDGGTRTAISES